MCRDENNLKITRGITQEAAISKMEPLLAITIDDHCRLVKFPGILKTLNSGSTYLRSKRRQVVSSSLLTMLTRKI